MVLAVGSPVPRVLADAAVVDPAGAPHRLDSTWRERDVVLVFVRHFACAGCAEQLAALRPRQGELATLAVDVVIVGNGSPDQLAAFIEREDIGRAHVSCFTDPSLAAYRAAGLVRSRWGTLGPIALGQLGRAYLGGHRNGRPQGDLYQQGGTLYITHTGVVAFYQRATSLGDHASLGDVVDIALAQRAGEAAIA